MCVETLDDDQNNENFDMRLASGMFWFFVLTIWTPPDDQISMPWYLIIAFCYMGKVLNEN